MNLEQHQSSSPLPEKQDLSSSQLYEEDVLLQQTSKDLLSRQEEIIRQFEEKLSKTVQLVKQNCSLQSVSNNSEIYSKEEQFEQQQIDIEKYKNFDFQPQQQNTNLFENKIIEQNIQCIKEESNESEKEEYCEECIKKDNDLVKLKEDIKMLQTVEKDFDREKCSNTRKFQELKQNNLTLLNTIEEKYKISFEIQKQKYEEKYKELLNTINQREDESNKKILELTTKNKKLYNLIIQLEIEKSELSKKDQSIGLQTGGRSVSRQSKPNTNQIPRYKKQGANICTPKRDKDINFQNKKVINSLNNSLFTSGDKNQISQIDITNSVLQESTSANNFIELMNTDKHLNGSQTKKINNLSGVKNSKKILISARKQGKENSSSQFKKKIKEPNQKTVVVHQKQEKQQLKSKKTYSKV